MLRNNEFVTPAVTYWYDCQVPADWRWRRTPEVSCGLWSGWPRKEKKASPGKTSDMCTWAWPPLTALVPRRAKSEK